MSQNSKKEKRGPARRKKYGKHLLFRIVFCLLILAVLISAYALFAEPKMLTEKTAIYSSEKLNDTPEKITIAIFADTHFSEYYTPANFQKAVRKINEAHPDFIFFLGDLIDDFSAYEGDIHEVERALASLQAGTAKIAVFGNHDYGGKMEFRYPDVMEAGGFQLLVNEKADFDAYNLTVFGIDDMVIGYGDPQAADRLAEDRYNVVLCHEPDVADELTGTAADLMLSGHTHGRQVNLRIFDRYILPVYGKKYVKGRYRLDKSDGSELSLYVTGGIGTTKVPVRFGSPPEINIIELEKFPES